MWQPLYLVAVSFPIGILIGLTGIGGAALMTPFLILFLGTRADLAIGTDLVFSMFTKAAGSWLHWKQGNVDLRLVRRLASASLPAAALGTLVMTRLNRGPHGDEQLKAVIGVVLLVVVCVAIFRPRKPLQIEGTKQLLATLTYAAIAGFLVGLTSIGSGSLILPLLLVINRLPLLDAVGTDILHAAILVAFTSALHASIGGVDWNLVPWLLVGSLPGVVIGARLASRMPEKRLRGVVVGILLFSVFKLLA